MPSPHSLPFTLLPSLFLLLLLLTLLPPTTPIHSYISLQPTSQVSTSTSIQSLNICKSQCLLMHQHFPFQFKYHRYILRESVGDNKYFQGNCLFAVRGPNGVVEGDGVWYGWEILGVFVLDAGVGGVVDLSEVERWQGFRVKCEDDLLKLDRGTLASLKFQRVHSNFQYYDNGTFVNLEPFDDLNSLLNSITSLAP